MFSMNSIMKACKRHVSKTNQLAEPKRLKLDHKQETSTFDRQWEVLKDLEEVANEPSSWFKFSVASYNVLSQNLLETNKYLYKKCHPKHLSWQYRKSILKEELSYYQPDIICMQEVHKNEFSRFFLPELQKLGYFGLYKKRTSDKEDGCATFFKHDKFHCVASKSMEYHQKGVEVLNRDNVGLLLLLKPVVNGNQNRFNKKIISHEVDHRLHGDPVKFTDEAKEKLNEFRLCVANTHLLFNPKRGDVKLAQLMTLMAGIDDLTDGEEQAVVLCGDFNSQPRSGLYDFLLSGRLDCKDVAIKFFSGQVKPGSGDSLDDMGGSSEPNLYFRRRTLPPTFLEKVSALTDQCQFVEVIRKRLEKKRQQNLSRMRSVTNTRHIVGSKKKKLLDIDDSTTDYRDKDEESSSLTDFISWSESPISYTQGSGTISHNLRLRSTYDHTHYSENEPDRKEITCFLEKNSSTVDYIFFSLTKKILNEYGNEFQESSGDIAPALHELHLLKRLKLWTESEMKSRYSGMPNADLGSDHTILLAQFGVKLT